MKTQEDNLNKTNDRRTFLKLGFLASGAAVAGFGLNALAQDDAPAVGSGEKVRKVK